MVDDNLRFTASKKNYRFYAMRPEQLKSDLFSQVCGWQVDIYKNSSHDSIKKRKMFRRNRCGRFFLEKNLTGNLSCNLYSKN